MVACETTDFGRLSGNSESRAVGLARSGQHADAATMYIGLAVDAVGQERDRLTLLATEQWLDAGDVSRARRSQSGVRPPASGPLFPIWTTNGAALALFDGKPDEALQSLEPLSRQPLPLRDRLRVEALRADAWIQKRDPARAIELMTYRESLLSDSRDVEQNRNRLWQGLLYSNPQVLRQAAEAASDDTTRGWLLLGSLATSTGQQGPGWSNGIARWRDMHGRHPAMSIVQSIPEPVGDILDYPRQVALLLPLTGRFAANGLAIQNGFLGAYFATASALDEQQSVRIYDVNAAGGASAAYQDAIDDGAEFVVGPLLKSNVAELANDVLVPVPVLALNTLPADSLAPPGLFQFPLAPEDEASSAAVRALGDGHTRAVALVPNNDWGRRVLRSFTTEFEGLGGTLLDYRTYTPGVQDFSNEIENLMGIRGSYQRYQRMRANLGRNLQWDPRRRQDAEFIFIAADANHGRLLKSQLKFHYSGDLPAYSTSSVNSLDGRANSDLNGIMFADTPWLIDPQPWIRYLPELYEEHWPEQRRLGRLHAMGYDAYNLIAALFAARGSDMQELDGATGELFLDRLGRVHRRLAWAQFQSGRAVALPDQDEVGGPIQDVSEDGVIEEPSADDEVPWDPSQN